MGTRSIICLAILSVCCVRIMDAKRVLMIPMPFTSHTKYHTHVAKELGKLGHEVWVCMPPYVIDKNYLDTQGFEVLPYTSNDLNVEELSMNVLRDAFWDNKTEDVFKLAQYVLDHWDKVLRDSNFIQDVRNINPDLFVIDSLPHSYMMSVLAYKFGKPHAFLGTYYVPLYQRVPIPLATATIPAFRFTSKMSFWERVVITLTYTLYTLVEFMAYTDAVSRYAPERPYMPIRDLIAKAEITLVETDHILDYPQPTLPNVIRIGGTVVTPGKPLKDLFKSFIESAGDGVVLVSFGSYVLNIPEYVRMKMINAFSKLKFKVIWRVNMTSPNPEKIMTSLWLPQNDILAHPNVKVFVSHCGKNGQYEALYHAVPFLCLPLFGDQGYNAKRTSVKGWSLTSNVNTMTSDDLVTLITELHENKSYKANIQKSSEIFKVVQGLPVERAGFWLDHVMKYGGAYMRYAGQEIPSYQYYCLDLILFFSTIIVILISLLYCILMKLIGLLLKKTWTKKQKRA